MSDACTPQAFQPSPAHTALAAMAGDWEGRTQVWFEPGTVPDDSPVRGTVRSVLEGRFIVWDYVGSLGGKPLSGQFLIGWHVDKRRFESSWVDSFHTGTSILISNGLPDDPAISVLGHYGPEGGEWGWRTAFELEAPDALVIRAWNIMPGGEDMLAVETRLRRR